MTKMAAICMMALMAVDGLLGIVTPIPSDVNVIGYWPR